VNLKRKLLAIAGRLYPIGIVALGVTLTLAWMITLGWLCLHFFQLV
jgi:hypothetical protein